MKNVKNEKTKEMKVGETRETIFGKIKCVSHDYGGNDCDRCDCYVYGCEVELYGCGECRGDCREDGVEVVFELV